MVRIWDFILRERTTCWGVSGTGCHNKTDDSGGSLWLLYREKIVEVAGTAIQAQECAHTHREGSRNYMLGQCLNGKTGRGGWS